MKILFLLFTIGPSLLLVMPGGHSIIPILLSLVGVFYYSKASQNNPILDFELIQSWRFLLGGFYFFSLIGILIGFYHGNDMGHYEIYVPFILFPAVALLIRAGGWGSESWFISFAVGAIGAFFYACYQSIYLDLGRAFGSVGNPIPFGNSAVVMGMVSLLALVFYEHSGQYIKLKKGVLLFGVISGFAASLLSGSKGGWLSIFIIALSVSYAMGHRWSLWKRHLVAMFMVLIIGLMGLFAPSHLVKERIVSGLTGGLHWVKTGEVIDGSVGMRLEIWRLSFDMFQEKPFLGHGSVNAKHRWNELISTGQYDQGLVDLVKANPKFSSPDNEILGALKIGGAVGALGYVFAYIGTWLAFFRWRNHADHVIKLCSFLGLMLVPVYLEFGLSVSVFGTNVFRSTFVYIAIVLLSLITVRLNAIGNLNR